jgi:hypothetical protein
VVVQQGPRRDQAQLAPHRRPRHEALPALRVRTIRVTARRAPLSTKELGMDQLAATQASDIAGLQEQLAALGIRMTALESGLLNLEGSLQGLADDITAAVEQDVQDLLSTVGGVLGTTGGLGLSLSNLEATALSRPDSARQPSDRGRRADDPG